MKRIPLRARDGSVRAWALVDDEDFEWLNRWRWHVTWVGKPDGRIFYAQRKEVVDATGRQRTIKMHIQIMGARGVDHIDGDGLNNRRRNLRRITQRENMQNLRVYRTSRSGIRGVSLRKGRWRARATVAGEQHFLGNYDTPEEAGRVASAFRAARMPHSKDARATA